MSSNEISRHVPDEVAAFVERVRGLPANPRQGGTGRLIFALDATASRQPTWDLASQVQGELFIEAASGRRARGPARLLSRLRRMQVHRLGFATARSWCGSCAPCTVSPAEPRSHRMLAARGHVGGASRPAGAGPGVRRRLRGGERRRARPSGGRARPAGGARVHVPRRPRSIRGGSVRSGTSRELTRGAYLPVRRSVLAARSCAPCWAGVAAYAAGRHRRCHGRWPAAPAAWSSCWSISCADDRMLSLPAALGIARVRAALSGGDPLVRRARPPGRSPRRWPPLPPCSARWRAPGLLLTGRLGLRHRHHRAPP